MKKTITLIMALAMALTMVFSFAGCGADDDKLVVYTEAGFAPYEFVYNNEIVGVDIEIMKAVAEELGKELEVKDVLFDNIIGAVKSGKADAGAAGITITAERSEEVAFSIPYSSTEQYVIVKADNNTITSVETLKGLKIGVQQGTTSDLMVEGLINDKTLDGATLVPYNAPAVAAAGLGTKVDAVVTDKLTAQIIVSGSNNAFKTFKLVKADGTDAAEVEEYGICVDKNDTELLETINKVLEKLLADGSIAKWEKEYNDLAATIEE